MLFKYYFAIFLQLPKEPAGTLINRSILPIIPESKYFEGSIAAPVGGYVINDPWQGNGIGYFAGFVTSKLETFHGQKLKTPLKDCKKCSSILTTDLNHNYHTFTSEKEFNKEATSNEHHSLNYCSTGFISTIKLHERVLLSYFDKFAHLPGFAKSMISVMESLIEVNHFCCQDITSYFREFYIECRTKQLIRRWNNSLKTSKMVSNQDKMKKIKHINEACLFL